MPSGVYEHKIIPVETRFWRYVSKTDRCWLWTASTNGQGYGQIGTRIDGKRITISAHRLSFEIHYGPIPPGMNVLHSCDNPPCVNPEDLFLGTDQDNVNDMIAKHRLAIGEDRGTAKLSTVDVYRIREEWRNRVSQKQIAAEFNVTQNTISQIVNRKKWTHI